MLDKTTCFSVDEIEDAMILKTLDEVCEALEEKGYNSLHQIVGYLISGDPGYISSHGNARVKITEYDRTKILIAVLKDYLDR